MKNGKRIVLEASEGITFRVQEGEEGIVIRPIIKDCLGSFYSPKIPEGYVHLEGTWETGFVIQNQADKSEFVWIPVGWFDPDVRGDSLYHKELNPDLIQSEKKYGGFYIARYHASKENNKLVFKKGNMPWADINYYDAEAVATDYAKGSKDVQSCITSGAAFDLVLDWIIKSRAKTWEEVAKNSSSWGNYDDSPNSPWKLMPTGSNEKWSVLNIYDIAGNIDEWTNVDDCEDPDNPEQGRRGGTFESDGNITPWDSDLYYWAGKGHYSTSFRAILYLK